MLGAGPQFEASWALDGTEKGFLFSEAEEKQHRWAWRSVSG